MREAKFYEKRDDGSVHCFLCAQHCRVKPGEVGKCGVRRNESGRLMSLNYGRLVAESVDPIEKKPLFHYHPGSTSYSIAAMGCNLSCLFCQNADIAQAPKDKGLILGRETPPGAVVARARETGCRSVSYTYTEPTVFMEYALDVMAPARAAGLGNVFVTNGFMTGEALAAAAPLLDAANVDLKAFSDAFYHQVCGARLSPVCETLEGMKAAGVWVEVTTLLIPGRNDDPGELRSLAAFVAGLGVQTPWHVTAFHPAYRLTDHPPTPPETLRRARDIGLAAGLRYVYTGNIADTAGETTLCHACGKPLVRRRGFRAVNVGLEGGACRACGAPMAGVGLP